MVYFRVAYHHTMKRAISIVLLLLYINVGFGFRIEYCQGQIATKQLAEPKKQSCECCTRVLSKECCKKGTHFCSTDSHKSQPDAIVVKNIETENLVPFSDHASKGFHTSPLLQEFNHYSFSRSLSSRQILLWIHILRI